jgi:1,2-diacylglycerol-3-alpha-glucose alpha-1,2-galactosyltransferase
MNCAISPEMQQAYTEKSKAAAQEYSQARLARVWERFYREQAAMV